MIGSSPTERGGRHARQVRARGDRERWTQSAAASPRQQPMQPIPDAACAAGGYYVALSAPCGEAGQCGEGGVRGEDAVGTVADTGNDRRLPGEGLLVLAGHGLGLAQ